MVSTDNYSVIEDIEQYTRCIRFQANGIPLSDEDQRLLRFAMVGQYCIGLDLLLDGVMMSRSFVPFLVRNNDLDVISFGRFLKQVDGVIKDYTEDPSGERIWDYKHFKHACDCTRTYWDFIAPIRDVIEQYLVQPSASTFFIINQWLNFIQRCNCRSLDLATELKFKYLAKEAEMALWVYDDSILGDLSEIISEWCKSFTCEGFLPSHGPGSIAGKKGKPVKGEKYRALGTDTRLEFLSKYLGPIAEYSPLPFGSLERCSELVFVPKSLITQRSISKEPCSLQYFQQGVMHQLVDMINSSDLGRHVDLGHQEFSRSMARKGSVSGKYATIDLSDASDSVTKTLVKRIFRNSTLRNLLFCTRSDQTRIDQDYVILEKFAPMGSAVCFPVETIVFAACCELAVRRLGNRKLNYRVYGDDIIIDCRAVKELLSILDACHFTVNKTKSYWERGDHNFREACGGEYFDNIDVAPLRIPRKLVIAPKLDYTDADITNSYISLANEAFEFGYTTFRWYVLYTIKSMNEEYFRHLLFSIDGRAGLRTYEDCCTNFRLDTRFSSTLYRREAKALCPIERIDKYREKRIDKRAFDESIRLFEWHRTAAERSEEYKPSPDSVIAVDFRPVRNELRKKWIPL